MAIELIEKPRVCMYCGKDAKKRGRGEHIVPKAIGGGLTLNDISDNLVCAKCNNGVLSEVDKELCSRSHISTVASQVLDATIWQTWDVDHDDGNLLIEAEPLWDPDGFLKALVCYPQFIFDGKEVDFRGDANECNAFGLEDVDRVMRKAVKRAYLDYRAGKKHVLHFERIRRSTIHEGYRFPPRVFTRHSIAEIAKNMHEQSFIVRFTTEKEKHHALNMMSSLTVQQQRRRWGQYPGSREPAIATFFDAGDTLRGMLKIGLNLIAAYCPSTAVNHTTFNEVMRIISGEGHPHQDIVMKMGFVNAKDIEHLKEPSGGHAFRLFYHRGHWRILASLFGARIGFFVFIPGPNNERWRSADIFAPLRASKWDFKEHRFVQAMQTPKTQWLNIHEIAPSLKFQKTAFDLEIDVGPRKKRK